MGKLKAQRNARKLKRFNQIHPGETRTSWAKYKRDNNLPKIVFNPREEIKSQTYRK